MAKGALLSMDETHRLNSEDAQDRGEDRWLQARTADLGGQLPKAGWQSDRLNDTRLQDGSTCRSCYQPQKTTSALHYAPRSQGPARKTRLHELKGRAEGMGADTCCGIYHLLSTQDRTGQVAPGLCVNSSHPSHHISRGDRLA